MLVINWCCVAYSCRIWGLVFTDIQYTVFFTIFQMTHQFVFLHTTFLHSYEFLFFFVTGCILRSGAKTNTRIHLQGWHFSTLARTWDRTMMTRLSFNMTHHVGKVVNFLKSSNETLSLFSWHICLTIWTFSTFFYVFYLKTWNSQ